MPQPIAVSLANPPVGACPSDFNDVVALLNTLLSGSIPEPFTPYVVGASIPAVNQQGYLWLKLDGAGRPKVVMKFYNGNWRRVENGVPGEIRTFIGDPAGQFDANGIGLIGADWDGWALCNGYMGLTANFSNHFVIAANMDNSEGIAPYQGGIGWRTRIAGAPAAIGVGATSLTLTDATTYRPARPGLTLYKWTADGANGRTVGGNLFGDPSTPGTQAVLLAADAGNLTPSAIPIVPPYFAYAPVQWIGYDAV